jgi:hypothetical protein
MSSTPYGLGHDMSGVGSPSRCGMGGIPGNAHGQYRAGESVRGKVEQWLPTQWREPSKPCAFPLFPYHFILCTHIPRHMTAHEWAPLCHDVTRDANRPPKIVHRRTRRNHDLALCLGNPLLGQSLEGFESTKGWGQGEMGPCSSNWWCGAT